jgi:hypothetical protein
MKKYALLIGLVCCFVSCSTDDRDNNVQNTDIKSSRIEEATSTDPTKDWDKTRHNDDSTSGDDGN